MKKKDKQVAVGMILFLVIANTLFILGYPGNQFWQFIVSAIIFGLAYEIYKAEGTI